MMQFATGGRSLLTRQLGLCSNCITLSMTSSVVVVTVSPELKGEHDNVHKEVQELTLE